MKTVLLLRDSSLAFLEYKTGQRGIATVSGSKGSCLRLQGDVTVQRNRIPEICVKFTAQRCIPTR